MAINSPFGESSIFHESFEWMGDEKDDAKKQYKYLNIKCIRSGVIAPYELSYVSFIFEVESENIIDATATIKLFEISKFGLSLEKAKSITSIKGNGKTNVTFTLAINVLINASKDYYAIIKCDGLEVSTTKFKIENNSSKQNSSQSCGNQYKGLTKCVYRNGNYGPVYYGSQMMSSYKYFTQLVEDKLITSDEVDIIIAMSENEGSLDAIQSYDSEIVSAGAMQKTVSINGSGELSDQLWKFKSKFPQKYSQLLEKCKWEVRLVEEKNSKGIVVKTRYIVYYNEKTGDDLKKEIRNGFDKSNVNKQVDSYPLLPLIGLLRDKDFQSIQIEDFIERLYKSISKKPTKYEYPLYEYTKSKLGKALVLDHDINRPSSVSFYFGEALNRLYKKNPSIPKNPSEWSSNHANYEIKLLEIYGPIRGEKLIKNQPAMTDAAKRYNSLKKKL